MHTSITLMHASRDKNQEEAGGTQVWEGGGAYRMLCDFQDNRRQGVD